MKFLYVLLTISMGLASPIFAQTAMVDNSFKTALVLPQEVNGQTRYNGMVAYKFIAQDGSSLLCGTFVTFRRAQNDRYLRRAVAKVKVTVGATHVRTGIGYMPNVVFAAPKFDWNAVTGATREEFLKRQRAHLARTTFGSPNLTPVLGRSAKCRRTRAAASEALAQASARFAFPDTVHYTVRQ
ncbi:MAG: hypothetical protein AAF700_11775 [Pseudomonadota bacterium]